MVHGGKVANLTVMVTYLGIPVSGASIALNSTPVLPSPGWPGGTTNTSGMFLLAWTTPNYLAVNTTYTVTASVSILGYRPGTATTAILVTPVLSGIGGIPSSLKVDVNSNSTFTASPTCFGPCPSGIGYQWGENNTISKLSATTGTSVVFEAGSIPGVVLLTLNATLYGVSRVINSTITIVASSILESLTLSPLTISVNTGQSQGFTTSVSCSPNPCPSAVTYAWKLNATLGSLSSATGASTTFTAGDTGGLVQLTVTASLYGKMLSSEANITIPASSGGTTTSFFSSMYLWIAIAAVAVVVVAVAVLMVLRRRKPASEMPPEEKSPEPSTPATPPPWKED
jgi:hypothetical protein